MKRLLALFLASMVCLLLPATAAVAAPTDDVKTTTPVKHLVMLMQDNHSFDNYFGTYPGADGIPTRVCQRLSLTRASTKGCVKPFRLGDVAADDLGQSVAIQKRQLDSGKMDGFVAAYRRLGRDGTSAMGYYDGQDIPYYWNAAQQYVLFDRFFSSTSVGSRESYLYWLAGQAPESSKPLTDSRGYDQLNTVFDRLAAKNISAKFYVEHLNTRLTAGRASGGVDRTSQLVKVPLLSMKRFQDGGSMAGKVVDLSQYYRDLQNGSLPAVSYIVTTGSSENPPSRLAIGQRTVQKLSSELMRSAYWKSSAFIWTYDGWGGWYDHVVPPKVDAHGYGFRVPALLLSPYARKGVVDHTVLDYTSMLRFIEDNWGVKALASRDARSKSLASAFDFTTAPREASLIPSIRDAEVVATTNRHVTPVIYTVYGAALLGVTALVIVVYLAGYPRGSLGSVAARAQGYRPRRVMDSLAAQEMTAAWIRWYENDSPEAVARRRRENVDDATAAWIAWSSSSGVSRKINRSLNDAGPRPTAEELT
jgi:phospholipase C